LSSSNAPLSSRNFLYSKDQPEDTEDEGFDSNDIDFVSSDARLPESDLLEAIHSYSSHFYANAVDNRGSNDFASMDETALIAMGILLEELANHSLGETGDLVLVERDDEDESDLESVASGLSTGSRVRKRSNSVRSVGASGISSAEDSAASSRRKAKRNKKRARLGSFASEATATDRDVEAMQTSDD
jgi:hypothetical protein